MILEVFDHATRTSSEHAGWLQRVGDTACPVGGLEFDTVDLSGVSLETGGIEPTEGLLSCGTSPPNQTSLQRSRVQAVDHELSAGDWTPHTHELRKVFIRLHRAQESPHPPNRPLRDRQHRHEALSMREGPRGCRLIVIPSDMRVDDGGRSADLPVDNRQGVALGSKAVLKSEVAIGGGAIRVAL